MHAAPDDAPMLQPLFPDPSEAEYQAIADALAQSARRRWFLAEHARRARAGDAQALLGAVRRLEEGVERARPGPDPERLRCNLAEMARLLAHARGEVAALGPAAQPRAERAAHALRFLESRAQAMLEAWPDPSRAAPDPGAA